MVRALRSGHLAGAGTDVVDAYEPLPPWSRIWAIPNLLLTPHVTPKLADREGRTLEFIEANKNRFLAGEPLSQQLTREDVFSHPRPKHLQTLRRLLRAWRRVTTRY